jgi:Protein of unknown function (DUF3305)
MIEERIEVGLVLECRRTGGTWGGFVWRPLAVFSTPPDVEPWTALGAMSDGGRWYAGVYPVALYSTDTANYRDNLESGAPRLWVVLRPTGPEPPIEVSLVTADPAEGEGATEAGSNVVETMPMPDEIAGVVAAFIAAHHVERPVIKRRRDRAEPDVRWQDRPAPPPLAGRRKEPS